MELEFQQLLIFVVPSKAFLRVTEFCGNESEVTLKKVLWNCIFQPGASRVSHQCLGTVRANITIGTKASQYLTTDLKTVSPEKEAEAYLGD